MSDLGDIAHGLNAAQAALNEVGKEILRESVPIIGGLAVGRHMRDAKGEPRRRRREDSGPLRIVSGRLARSLTGARGRSATSGGAPEGIQAIEQVGDGIVRLVYGSKVPYAAIHEYGGVAGRRHAARIAARAYLNPALQEALPRLQEMAQETLRRFVVSALSGGDSSGFSVSLSVRRAGI